MSAEAILRGRWDYLLRGPGPTAVVLVHESVVDRRIARFETTPHTGAPPRVDYRAVGIDRDFASVADALAALTQGILA